MNLAVMQPYLFPYLGYFQLLYAADLFLIYDDVTFIKQGYINRNTIASASETHRFTIPVPGASSNRLISSLEFSGDVSKFLKQISQSYAQAPYRTQGMSLIEEIMTTDKRAIADLCQFSYEVIFAYLGLDISLKKTSDLDYNRSGSAKERLIALCKKFKANRYINLPGGAKLYTKEVFAAQGIDLKFIRMNTVHYSQPQAFIPNLSFIDVLMNCGPDEIVSLLGQYRLE